MTGFEMLLKGFTEFRNENYGNKNALMPRLAHEGQAPDYFIISCIDSRCHPGTIFRAPPGTFFAHKAMGAIVRPWQRGTALSAALQFAIKYNKVRKIIILGHTNCGAIRALVENLDDEEISSFIEVARTGLEKARACCSDPHPGEELLRHTEEQIVLQSTENLKTYPVVRKALEDGRVEVASWIFNMEEGTIYSFSSEKDKFVPLDLI